MAQEHPHTHQDKPHQEGVRHGDAPAGPSDVPDAGPARELTKTPSFRPYDMPSTPSPAAHGQPIKWGGGGPVGTGVVPVDVEAQVMHDFADRLVRQGFMRKVFGIVAAQLLFTVCISLICLLVTPVKVYVRTNPWPFYMSWGTAFGLMLVISCNERLRRRYPANMIMLGLFTLAEAFLVGMITSFFDVQAVAIAFIATAVAVCALAVIACQKKLDVTHWGSMLMVCGVVLIVLVLLGTLWRTRVLFLVIAGVAALLSAAYLVYDLQLIMGGKQYAISPDEYVFAALSVYLDIVQMFLWLLYLIGFASNSR
ncbi:inhibitor of apoptosis-promoting Bax1-domain-containing protein [Haematococcus lacustris]